MSKLTKAEKATAPVPTSTSPATEPVFAEIVGMITQAREQTYRAINTALIDLYWHVGEYISKKIAAAEWGEGVVKQLAIYIAERHPEIKGFTRASLFRMRQFYDVYQGDTKVAQLVRQLPWGHNLRILSRCKYSEERTFYLKLATREKWSRPELERQLSGALFERAILAPPKVSPLVRQLYPDATTVFKDTYLFNFLDLPQGHNERNLKPACGGKFQIPKSQIPNKFQIPTNLRHLRQRLGAPASCRQTAQPPNRKSRIENRKFHHALSRSLSPALIAEYQTKLPDKQYLQSKLHEFYQLTTSAAEAAADGGKTLKA
jgi:predicted nuclease of restriction endonuclease-like (RecB) superfamily